MEYKKGSQWETNSDTNSNTVVTATRANRFIVSKDESNAVLATLEPLNQQASEHIGPCSDYLIHHTVQCALYSIT